MVAATMQRQESSGGTGTGASWEVQVSALALCAGCRLERFRESILEKITSS